jgi:hypothetical protein
MQGENEKGGGGGERENEYVCVWNRVGGRVKAVCRSSGHRGRRTDA